MKGRPFKKGQSGNPGGRPRVAGELRVLARQHVSVAIGELARLALKAKSESVRVAAIRELFDRGYGKTPPLSIELPSIGEWDGTQSVLCAYKVIIDAVSTGLASPTEGVALVSLIEAQRAAVKELRPEAMYAEPTPEQLAQQKKRDEAFAKVFDKFQTAFGPD
jgi:hypothetical protein